MSEHSTIRKVLLGEKSDRMRKLDQLVRQGMMSSAALPMLHRGLDKLQAGKTLSPTERDAVAKVMDSLMYIVTGDDTVFQKAKQHTQKNRYRTEETLEEGEQLDEDDIEENRAAFSGAADRNKMLMKYQKAGKTASEIGDPKKRAAAKAALPKIKKRLDYGMRENEEYDNEGEMAKSQLSTIADAAQELMGMLSDDQNLPEWVQSKITKATDYLDSARDYVKSEGDNGKAPVGEASKVGGASLTQSDKDKLQKTRAMLDAEKRKKFPHNTSATQGKRMGGQATMYGEEVEQLDEYGIPPAVKKPVSQMTPSEKKQNDERRKAYNTFQKRKRDNEQAVKDMKGMAPHMKNPALGEDTEQDTVDEGAYKDMVTKDQENKRLGKTTLIANPKTQRVRKVTPSRAKMAVKKGFVYAEEWTDEEVAALVEMEYKDKFQVMLKKTGKSLDKMSDEEKKKFFNAVDAAHKAKSEETVDEASAADVLKKRYASNRPEDNPQATKIVKDAIPGVKTDKIHPHAGLTNRGYSKKGKMAALKKQHARRPEQYGITREGYAEDLEENAQQAMRDARRAMRADSKGMAPLKKPGGTKSYKGTAGEEKHGGHIVMQLRKAVTVGKPIKFKDGSTKSISKAHAHKFLSKYNASKPAQKADMHDAHDSHDAFMKHINNK